MFAPAQFEVWAPYAQRVHLILDGEEVALVRDTARPGWWFAANVRPRPGQRYAFSLFDGTSWTPHLPDPRTRRQPEGVHGTSEVIFDDFVWSDGAWRGRPFKGQVIYELHVGTFTHKGTFAGVVDKLDYLVELGVTAIQLMPVQPFGGERNWGYDGVDWLCVHEAYGGPQGLKELVDAAHNHNIAIFLDVVYNHFGPDGNYTGFFGPYTTSGHTGWGDVVNLSGPGSDEVRDYICDAVRQWLGEFHIDGLRLDAVHAFDDRLAYSIMEDIRVVAADIEAATGIPRHIIAESDLNDPRIITEPARGGYGLTAQWLDDVHHGVHAMVSGEIHGYYSDYAAMEILADTLAHGYRFRGGYSAFRGRRHGRALDLSHTAPWRLVTYTTTHDQTGNRAAGDRPSQSLTFGQLALKAAVIFFCPFTPMLFMGEEFAARSPFPFFISHSDEGLNRMTREGRLREFSRMGWDCAEIPDPAAMSTFLSARLDWGFAPEQKRMLDVYRRFIALRRELRLDRDDLRELKVLHGEKWLVAGYEDVVLAANFSAEVLSVPAGGEMVYGIGVDKVEAAECVLGPWGFAVLANSRR
ncbi:malto-oligosyltrehalose trehalohydrolase [Corynebacterium mayonis]|uniref:malto-oligosyltrehalose trehalohydrolase n=1 Tax=Corynebacterium mayonis TaxID=3062461 RepID=UPI00313FFBA3